jgi:hypothetical protein
VRERIPHLRLSQNLWADLGSAKDIHALLLSRAAERELGSSQARLDPGLLRQGDRIHECGLDPAAQAYRLELMTWHEYLAPEKARLFSANLKQDASNGVGNWIGGKWRRSLSPQLSQCNLDMHQSPAIFL